MAQKIRVLVVDDIEETRENIKRLLLFEDDIDVIGEAEDGHTAILMTEQWKPDVVLMDINMPNVDGVTATEQISLRAPESSVVIMSVQGEQEYLRKAMVAGAKEYLVKPFTGDELTQTIKNVYGFEQQRRNQKAAKAVGDNHPLAKGKVVTIFSPKGGVGKTTIATNMGVTLAKEGKGRVVLVDLDLQFGDVGIMLNIVPRRSIAELAEEQGGVDIELLENYLMNHQSGLKILPAPLKPEQAEYVTPDQVGKIVGVLRKHFDYVLIDTAPSFNDIVLTALDQADKVVMVAAFDLPTIKNIKLGLEVMENLNYPRDKFSLILNKATGETGVRYKDVESALGYTISHYIPLDFKLAMMSVNKGIPLVQSHPNSEIGRGMVTVARSLVEQPEKAKVDKKKKGWLLKPAASVAKL